jgi:hypothetical protein
LGIESRLQSFDLSLLIGDSLLLIGNLLVVTDAHRRLPFLLLALVCCLAVLLELLVAGVSGKPDQAIGPGQRNWGQGLHGYSLLAAGWGLKVTGVQLVGWLISTELASFELRAASDLVPSFSRGAGGSPEG